MNAVRLVLDNQGQDEFRWSAIRSISTRIGCAPQTLNGWIKRPEVDSGKRAGSPSERAEKLKAVERAVRALLQGEEVLRKAVPCPLDPAPRQFHAPAPNRLWLSDFTCVAPWAGFVCVAFGINTCAGRIAGRRASRTAHAVFVPDALVPAVDDRRPAKAAGLVHPPDRGAPYLAIKSAERRAEAGIEASVGSGDRYDNPLAGTLNHSGACAARSGATVPAKCSKPKSSTVAALGAAS